MKKQKPIIAKPDASSKKADSKSKRTEPNQSALKPIPPSPKLDLSNHRSIKPRFNTKIISEKYLLNPNDFEPINKNPITGGFGIIKFVRNTTTGKEYAAKTSHRETNPQERKFVLRELNILMKIQHPTIIHLEGFSFQDFNGNDNITIFMDYMKKGTLFDILEKEQKSLLPSDFDNTKRQIILVGISRGMMILHKNTVIHRDLKPENIFLDDDYKPLITDFGLSKIFTSQNSQTQSMAKCGTYSYMAPEVIEGNHFGTKADVYSFGILMYEVVTGKSAMASMTENKPFNVNKFMKNVVSGKRPTFSDQEIKPGLRRMIEKCWSNNPDERPTFSELYSKLSLNDEDFYVDSNNNINESIIKCSDDNGDNDELLVHTKYCLDDVDFDELFLYVDEINEETKVSNNDEQLETLKKEINEVKKYTKKVEDENKNLKKTISKIKKENKLLKDNVSEIINENKQVKDNVSEITDENNQLKDNVSEITNENKQLKNDILELKEMILNLKKEQEIIEMSICNQDEELSEEELHEKCLEFAAKAKSGEFTMIKLPRNLQKVPDSLFQYCKKLETVKIPSSVKEIEDHAFNGCESLKQITIPSSVTTIGSYSFYNCESIEKIIIPSSVTKIGQNAFDGCKSMIQITIPSSITVLEYGILTCCSSLTQITIPSSVTSIEDSVFRECSSLKQIVIPPSVTSIGFEAFRECSSLTQITIPSSVSTIGSCIFIKCCNIKEIIVTPCDEVNVKYIENKFLVCKKSYFYDSFDVLLCANSTSKKVSIPPSIKSIQSVSSCSNLTQITIPSSVTEIEPYVFSGCSSLTQVTIPSSVTKFKSYAFSESSLTQLTIPSSVTEIESYAFSDCTSLTQVTIPSSITEIGFNVFRNCSSLTQVTIPSSVTKIGDYAFCECTSLKKVTIPSSVTEIGQRAFFQCTSLKKITIPSSITSIAGYTFRECTSLTQATIPSSVTSIGDFAFCECSSLKEIKIPSSVTSIGTCAFSSETNVIKVI